MERAFKMLDHLEPEEAEVREEEVPSIALY